MNHWRRRPLLLRSFFLFCLRALALLALAGGPAEAGGLRIGSTVAAVSEAEAESWGSRIEAFASRGDLRLVSVTPDPDLRGRQHLRYEQRVGGLRVFGAQLVRQVNAAGQTLTVFGHVVEEAEACAAQAGSSGPGLTATQATRVAEAASGHGARVAGEPELVLLPLGDAEADDDCSNPAYMLWIREGLGLERVFVDARTGQVVLRYNDLRTTAAVGVGTGVWGDRKKVSADSTGSTFRAVDNLRPAPVLTYDMRFDVDATLSFLDANVISDSLLATSADNIWTDGGVVDAHDYAGYTYDYYFKRHGRRGIDGRNRPVRSLTHVLPLSSAFANAFWEPFTASMLYGDGDDVYDLFSGAIDVAAHEMTHGVTQFTWNAVGVGESGALNESFSDIMGTAVEFFFQPAGNGRLMADYWLGEDLSRVFDPPVFAVRSMDNPAHFCHPETGCDPDNYSRRYRGPFDGGGTHANAGISNQAFYLLVEGGTNRTSGIHVQGIGGANRGGAERIFYRGFTLYLTPTATFSDARRATLQAAGDLFGGGTNEAAQVAAAWTAVGVN